MNRYIALIHKDEESDYGIMFPDFPGCVSVADTVEDAVLAGREALAFHVEGMRQDGESIPAPRTLEEIKEDSEDWVDWDGAVAVLIPLLPSKGQAVRVNVNIDKNLLAAADAAAERSNQTRSAFISRALETALGA
ncbi:MAG: type II toxin-antitoxin system HicB family antitoxin [Alphaproteobacteria bacterium]|nr:type II toxin-antitoxin system HicB family antitoxin [Alphaproteobacteria bacterium]